MNRNFFKLLRISLYVAAAACAWILLHYGRRVFVADSFIVRGCSMEPTFSDGEKVYVNKLKMGARIYTDFDFSSGILKSFRVPGLTGLERGDLVVANYPYPVSNDTISFRINYVYLKRCYGIPGDSLRIVDGYYRYSSATGVLGDPESQRLLSGLSDVEAVEAGLFLDAFHQDKSQGWTIRDFGPLYIPGKGDTVEINARNFRMWRKMIMFETGFMPQLSDDGKILLNGSPISKYCFTSDWYFLGGDNVLNSRDSRYIGLFPESYIVGTVNEKNRRI